MKTDGLGLGLGALVLLTKPRRTPEWSESLAYHERRLRTGDWHNRDIAVRDKL